MTGSIGHTPVAAAADSVTVVPFRRAKDHWVKITDYYLRDEDQITALVANGSHVFAGTAKGEVFALCPTAVKDQE